MSFSNIKFFAHVVLRDITSRRCTFGVTCLPVVLPVVRMLTFNLTRVSGPRCYACARGRDAIQTGTRALVFTGGATAWVGGCATEEYPSRHSLFMNGWVGR